MNHKFSSFADVAISAEKIILMDPEASIINCRRAMEFAMKWMYSVDIELEMPYQDNLQSLMNAEEYQTDCWIRIFGNVWIIFADAEIMLHIAIKNLAEMKQCFVWKICLFILDYIAYCYSDQYEEHSFDKTLINISN